MPDRYKSTIFERLDEKACKFIEGYETRISRKFDIDDMFQVGYKQVQGSLIETHQYYMSYLGHLFVLPYYYSKDGKIVGDGKSIFNFVRSLNFPDSIECIFLREIKIVSGYITLDKITIYTVDHIGFRRFIEEHRKEDEDKWKLLSETEQAELDRYTDARKTRDDDEGKLNG